METVKRVFIQSKEKTTETDNTETIFFDEPFLNLKEIRLNSIQVHNTFHNISKNLGNNSVTFTIVSSDQRQTRHDYKGWFKWDGFYNWKDIENELNETLNSDLLPTNYKGKITIKIEYSDFLNYVEITKNINEDANISDFRISGEFLSLLGFKYTKLKQLPATSDYSVKLFPFTNFYVHCDLTSDSYMNSKRSDILCVLPVDQSKRWWDPVTYKDLNCKFNTNIRVLNYINLWITDEKGNHIDFNNYPVLYELGIVLEEDTKKELTIDTIVTKIANRIKDKFPADTNEELD